MTKSTWIKMALAVVIVACSALSASADAFTIEKDDPRPFRVHCGSDETSKTKAMMRELANEVKRVTGVAVETPRYELASAGDFFVATEPWAAKGAWTIRLRNGVICIHGSDVAGT